MTGWGKPNKFQTPLGYFLGHLPSGLPMSSPHPFLTVSTTSHSVPQVKHVLCSLWTFTNPVPSPETGSVTYHFPSPSPLHMIFWESYFRSHNDFGGNFFFFLSSQRARGLGLGTARPHMDTLRRKAHHLLPPLPISSTSDTRDCTLGMKPQLCEDGSPLYNLLMHGRHLTMLMAVSKSCRDVLTTKKPGQCSF